MAGIVLAGGKSTRMGRDKATLPFGPEALVHRMARVLGEVVSPIVVVAAAEQSLPPLPPTVLIARDQQPGRGPLEGISAGLSLLEHQRPGVQATFVTACDAPLLTAGFVAAMIDKLGDAQMAVPIDQGKPHPLSAVYRMDTLPLVRELLAANRLQVTLLLELATTVRVDAERLRAADLQLWSLKNCNLPADYEEALRLVGFSPRRP